MIFLYEVDQILASSWLLLFKRSRYHWNRSQICNHSSRALYGLIHTFSVCTRLFFLFFLLATPAFRSNSSLTFLDGLPPGSSSPQRYYLQSAMPRYWLSSRKRTSIGSCFQNCFSVLLQAQTVSFSAYFLKCRTHRLSTNSCQTD